MRTHSTDRSALKLEDAAIRRVNTPPDFTPARQAAAAASVFCKVQCPTCSRILAVKLQGRIRFQPALIIPRSAPSTHFCTTPGELNTSGRLMSRRSKGSSCAPTWKESFRRSKLRTQFCLRFVSLVNCQQMTRLSLICPAAVTRTSNSSQTCKDDEPNQEDVRFA